MLTTAFTSFGPALALTGLATGLQSLFWVGVALCAVNLFLNLASGVMNFPILPLACMIVGAVAWAPWLTGVAAGLVGWTALEALGEIVHLLRRRMR